MRVAAIPDSAVLEGHQRIIMRAPNAPTVETEVRDCEMLFTQTLDGPIFRARIVLDKGDLERLAAGEHFWVSLWGSVVPFDVAMEER